MPMMPINGTIPLMTQPVYVQSLPTQGMLTMGMTPPMPSQNFFQPMIYAPQYQPVPSTGYYQPMQPAISSPAIPVSQPLPTTNL